MNSENMTKELVDESETIKVGCNTTNRYYNSTNTCDGCGEKFEIRSGHPCKEYNEKHIWTGKWLCTRCYTNHHRYGTYEKPGYNLTNTCHRCGKKLPPACKEKDEKGNWTGKWLCRNCWYNTDYKLRPDSCAQIRKQMTKRRIGNLDNPNMIKGDIFEEVTCIWRGVDNLNIEDDNFHSPIDHSVDKELGIIQTKGVTYDIIERNWHNRLDNEHKKKFNNLIFYCADRNMKNIIRVYIFPWEEIIKRTSVSIIKNPSRSTWYEQYAIKDEKILEHINKIFQEIC